MQKITLFIALFAMALITALFAMSRLEPGLVPREEGSPFGVIFNPEGQQWEASDQIAQRLVEAGVRRTILRLVWSEVEPEEGVYQWEKYDRLIAGLSRAGLDVMVIVAATPDWATNAGPGARKGRRRAERKQANRTPTEKSAPPPGNPADLVQFVSSAAERYQGKVKTWSLYNAVQNQTHWIEPSYLAELYKAVYPVLKKVDPEVRVAMPGLESGKSGNGRSEKYLTAFLEAGGGQFVDMYDFHLFAPLSGIQDELLTLQGILKQFRQENKPVQIGSTGDHANFHPTPDWVEKQKEKGWKPWDYQATTPEIQADRLVIRMVWARALGAERVFWAKVTDRQPTDEEEGASYQKRKKERGKPEWKVESDWGSSSGILTFDLQDKPAYHALKTLIERLDGAEPLHSIDIGPVGKAYLFRRGGGFVGVFWVWEGNKRILLQTTARQIRVLDKYGHERKRILPQGGRFTLRVGTSPLYLEGEGEIGLAG